MRSIIRILVFGIGFYLVLFSILMFEKKNVVFDMTFLEKKKKCVFSMITLKIKNDLFVDISKLTLNLY